MVIKKFDEYINELWSKGIKRSMTGEKRLENEYPYEQKREIGSEFIDTMLDYANAENECDDPEIYLEFTSFLKLDDNDFKIDEDDIYPEWDINDALDRYTIDEFLEKCRRFIENKNDLGPDRNFNFDYKRFDEILKKVGF